MASAPNAHGIPDPVELCLHRFKSIFDMHLVKTGSPEALPGFVQKLKRDRYFAMDFWALVDSAPHEGRMAISREKVFDTVIHCVGGPDIPASDPNVKEILRDLDGMASPETGGGVDAAAFPEQGSANPAGNVVTINASEVAAAERPTPAYTLGEGGYEPEGTGDPEENGDAGKVEAPPYGGSRQIDEALSRLEISSHELKLHLGEIESKMGRMEPHLEGLTSLVARSGAQAAEPPQTPREREHERYAAGVLPPVSEAYGTTEYGPDAGKDFPASQKSATRQARDRFERWLALSRAKWRAAQHQGLGTRENLALLAAMLVLLICAGVFLLYQYGPKTTRARVMPASLNFVDTSGLSGGKMRMKTGSGNTARLGAGATSGAAASGSPAGAATGKPPAGAYGVPSSGRPNLFPAPGHGASESNAGFAAEAAAPGTVEPSGTGGRDAFATATGPDYSRTSGSTGGPGGSRRVSVSSGVMASNLIESVPPKYPRMAALAHIQGPVVLQAVISKRGKVDHVHIIKGHYLLRGAAANAVRHWRYRPYLLNGRPVEVATIVTVDFSLKK